MPDKVWSDYTIEELQQAALDGTLTSIPYEPQEPWCDGLENYTPLTEERMNRMELGIQRANDAWDSKSQAVVLYDSGGVIGYNDKPLADDVTNYSYIEIYYGQLSDFICVGSVKVPVINGAARALLCSAAPSSDQTSVAIRTRRLDAIGTTLKIGTASQCLIYRNGFDKYTNSVMPVYRVIGHR